jgi:hypothetical protein
MRQDGERLPTQAAQFAPYPKVIVLAVVRWFPPLPLSNDGGLLTEGTPTRQLVQTNPRHPGTTVSSEGAMRYRESRLA